MLTFNLRLHKLICDKFIIEQNFYGIIMTLRIMISFQVISSPTRCLIIYSTVQRQLKKVSMLWSICCKQCHSVIVIVLAANEKLLPRWVSRQFIMRHKLCLKMRD